MWEELLKFSIGSISILGCVTYLGKVFVDVLQKREIANYKNELDIKFEEYKMKLAKESFEHQTKFIKIHEERANAIKEIYSLLADVEENMNVLYLHIKAEENLDKEIVMSAYDSLLSFGQFAKKNRILWDEETVFYIEEIEAVFSIVIGTWEDLKDYEEENKKKHLFSWCELARHLLRSEVTEQKVELEKKFRDILEFAK